MTVDLYLGANGDHFLTEALAEILVYPDQKL